MLYVRRHIMLYVTGSFAKVCVQLCKPMGKVTEWYITKIEKEPYLCHLSFAKVVFNDSLVFPRY